jgi:hypothetical protein
MLIPSLIFATLAFDGFGSINTLGYVNVSVPPGFSLLSNPLINRVDSRIFKLFGGDYPDGCKIFLLRSGGFITVEYFADSKEWLPAEYAAIELFPGEGFFFQNAGSTLTITFVGEVPQGTLTNHIPAGYSLRASMVPTQDTLDHWDFPAEPGDQVFILNPKTGGYTGYWFDEFELRWQPSPPPFTVGEAFYVFKGKAADWVETFSVIPR